VQYDGTAERTDRHPSLVRFFTGGVNWNP
jgi:hypothetical protein